MFRLTACLIASFLVAPAGWSATDDPLKRRGYLGAALESATPSDGILVTEVFPSSPAAAAGLEKSDVLLNFGGTRADGVDRVNDFVRTISGAREGDVIEATIVRGGVEEPVAIRIASLPTESNPDFETRYDAVEVNGWKQRVILTVPRGDGPHPAIAFLQGVSCNTIESPLQPEDRIRQLVSEWTRAGFAVMRIEKSGVGDSEGPACIDSGFQTELLGYQAGVRWLLAQPGIDAQRVFLFGHSMGGVFAPVVARDLPVRGIIVYGTIGVPLAQYFHENDARQLPMSGYSGTALERELERADEFIELFFGQRLTPAQIEERAPHLRGFLRLRQADATHLFGRHYTFWHELDDLGLPAPWTHVTAPVLSIWGNADFPASRGDHVVLAQTVNDAGKTHARFVEMENIGHGFDQASGMGESMANGMMGPFDSSIIDVTTAWMRGIAAH